ncbi:MAG: ABC transporter permease [Chitinophagia bacterium]|nr:ABC transporter permease [Chitinophagia bacterium]
MNKLWLIIKREYLVRVKKKSFIITTLLTPLGIGLLVVLSAYLTAKGGQASKKVLVKDDSGVFSEAKIESKLYTYDFSKDPLEKLKEDYKTQTYDLLVYIPPFEDLTKTKHSVEYYSQEKLSIATIESIETKIGSAFKEYKITQSGIDRNIYDSFRMDIDLENGAAGKEEMAEGKSSSEDTSTKLSILIGTLLGGLMGFIMYMVIFIYGSMVMRSVMEEKINRIVEVIISSVKPTQLMMGKVLGVGGVGLTQLAMWLILIPMVIMGTGLLVGGGIDPAQIQEMSNQANVNAEELNKFEFGNVLRELGNMNWGLIIPVFILFFFGGYFIYSSLFAAVGSAMGDDMGEGQQLMLPIMLPVILGFIMLQGTLQNPNGGMAVFGSLFPLTSPIIMPSRLAFDPPLWQVGLSIILLVLSCWFFAWLAGRIYRVGILMYGKKITFKELGKWIMYKG